MAISTSKRKTITISEGNWKAYCTLKGRHLQDLGKPEITFTEFVNASIQTHPVTLEELLELRRKEK